MSAGDASPARGHASAGDAPAARDDDAPAPPRPGGASLPPRARLRRAAAALLAVLALLAVAAAVGAGSPPPASIWLAVVPEGGYATDDPRLAPAGDAAPVELLVVPWSAPGPRTVVQAESAVVTRSGATVTLRASGGITLTVWPSRVLCSARRGLVTRLLDRFRGTPSAREWTAYAQTPVVERRGRVSWVRFDLDAPREPPPATPAPAAAAR